MDQDPRPDVTLLLTDASLDADERANRLLPIVYDQLRATAQKVMASESPGHTLQATALVHEAYLKLLGNREVPWQNQAHFYGAAAEAMRRILLDHARTRKRVKRGGGKAKISLELAGVADLAKDDEPEAILAFDDAFGRLESESPDAAAVVRLRFYAGLTVPQTAQALGISARTVDRQWAFARAWMLREIKRASQNETADEDHE